MSPDRDSYLPPLAASRGPRRRDWGRSLARLLCVIFAIIGVLPVGVGMLVRSHWIRGWAIRETTRILERQGLHATFDVQVTLWPLALSVIDVRLPSSDGGAPALLADRASVRPRFFALLSGKLAIEQIELDSPHVRVVLRDGKLQNLPIELPKTDPNAPKKAFHAPFSVIAVTDASVDIDIDGTVVKARAIDVDVTAEDDPTLGSSFEVGLSSGPAIVRHAREVPGSSPSPPPPAPAPAQIAALAVDDDALCSVEGRLRIEPGTILVRRFAAVGAVDLDAAAGLAPACDLPQSDARRVELALAHVNVELPDEAKRQPPRAHGHIRTRIPLAIAARFVALPPVDGWVSVDADVRYADDTQIPDVTGHASARDVVLGRYHFAKEIDTDIEIRKNVITSPRTVVKIADGTATLTDTVVEPLRKGIPLRTTLDAREIDFASLMRDLGVSDHAHVTWDIQSIKVPALTGTLDPLKLDGDLALNTTNFAVFDKARDDPARARLVGFKEASVTGKVAVRPTALEFRNINAQLPGSVLEEGFCSIGFDNDFIADVPRGRVDIADIEPIGNVSMRGIADISLHAAGQFTDIKLEADAQIAGYVLGDIPFGDVTAVHAAYRGTVVDLANVVVKKGKSQYEVPTARLDFGAGAGVIIDAVGTSRALGLRDFFAIFKMEEDPRFAELDAEIGTRAVIHVALGGPEDVCGDGFIEVNATAHLKKVTAFGETFDDGDVSLLYRWTDRRAGVAGAEIEIRSVVLHKAIILNGTRTLGSVLGSVTVRRGGALAGGVVIESIPLGRLQKLGALAKDIDGSVSGFAQVGGTIDAFRIEAELDVTPVRLRGVPFGASHLHITMAQNPPPAKIIGTTKCGGVIGAEFDEEAWLRDRATRSQGDYVVDGDMLGRQVLLDRLTMSQELAPRITGSIGLRKLDVGAMLRVAMPPKRDVAAGDESVPELPPTGELTGDLTIADLRTDDIAHAYVRFVPTSMFVERSGQRLSLHPGHAVVKLSHDMLSIPDIVFDLKSASGLTASLALRADVIHLSRDPEVNADIALAPVDLALLVGIVPRFEQSAGVVSGNVHVTGRAASPEVDGQLKLRGGEFSIRGSPSVLSDVEIDVQATSSEVRVTRGTAKYAGGTVDVRRATLPVRDLALGAADADIELKDIHLPGDGMAGTVDARLAIALNPQGTGVSALPHVSGEVVVTSFDYTRQVNLIESNLTALGARSLGVRAQRTVVESYDPSQDAVTFDVRVRSRSPFRIRNDLVDAQLKIDSGTLAVTGTNQRFGLRGELKTLPGGRFRFRNTDFEIARGLIRFEDPTRIAPNIDVIATTEYHRYQQLGGSRAGGSAAAASSGATTSGLWRITLHVYGDGENLRMVPTSEPPLSQEDIVLLLTIGMTRAEVDQVRAGAVGAGLALEALASVSGADRAVKAAVPVIDDFRFGSAYSPRAGQTVPQISLGKRLTDNVRAQVTTGLSENRELRSNIEWRLGQRSSVLGSYDNVNSISASPLGNLGVDFRWRLEFE